jgi:hypothetical protein
MIDIRPLNPAHTSGDRDTLIGRFADSEWQDLIELARRYGFEPPNDENYLPSRYDEPIEIDAETSQGLLEAISAACSTTMRFLQASPLPPVGSG